MSARASLLLCLILFSGCSTNVFPLAERAAAENLSHHRVGTEHFEHSVYRKEGDSDYQVVFIEGDGRPWNAAGTAPSRDPTPRDALAFDLLLATPVEGFYVTRPCYFDTWSEACSADTWTSGRYSQAVVTSLAEAVRVTADTERPLMLVGYSGGGTLAILVAQELEDVHGVVIVAGVVDTDAWTGHHGYEPLSQSINPAILEFESRQLHLHGTDDTVVPLETIRGVVARWPNAALREFNAFDHVCCWRRDWQRIWEDVENTFRLDGHPLQSDSSSRSQ